MRWRKAGDARILDFDLECRASHWIGGDYVSKEITAIGWKFIDDPGDVKVQLAHPCDTKQEWTAMMRHMLLTFVKDYDRADIVTGHYIKGFDLPLLNAHLFEVDLPILSDKRAQDTKIDLVQMHGLSKAQEGLGSTMELFEEKVKMNQGKWRWANRLVVEGQEEARTRVAGDVVQHIEMREELLRRGMLKTPPNVWRSGGSSFGLDYTP